MSEVIPPDNFHPLSASTQLLATYDFPPRPSNPGRLKEWARLRPGVPGMCLTNLSVGALRRQSTAKPEAVIGNYNSTVWAGGINFNGLFTESSTEFYQSAFDSSKACGGVKGSAYATWSGIGGYDTGKLLQAGTLSALTGVDDIFGWWEMVSPSYDTGAVQFNGSTAIASGDDIATTTSYLTGAKTVQFYVDDYTKNFYYSTSAMSSAPNGGPATSTFYDNSTAEYITENPANLQTGARYDLRKPHLGNTEFFEAYANGEGSQSYDSATLTEKSAKDIMQTTSFDGLGDDWENQYNACT